MHTRRDWSVVNLLALPTLLLLASLPAAAAGLPDSPDGTVKAVMASLADGHPEILWQALPASYQRDLTDVTHAFAAKMDPEIWNAGFGLAQKAVGVLRDKKQYILGSSMMAAAGDKKAEAERNWDTVVALLDSFFSSDVSQLDSLKTIDWGQYLSTTGAQIMEHAVQMAAAKSADKGGDDFVTKLRNTTVEAVSSQGDTATLRISSPGKEPEESSMTRVEGRWVPTEMATDWDAKMAETKGKIAAITPDQMAQGKAQVMALFGMVNGALDQLAATTSQEEFDQTVKGLLGPFMGMAGQMQQNEPPASADES